MRRRTPTYGVPAVPLVLTRAELLDRLANLRTKAEKTDAANLRKHQTAERRYLVEFQKACRKAASWDYETAKANNFIPKINDKRVGWNTPSCPRSEASRIDSFIGMVNATTQPTFRISQSGMYSVLFHLLTKDVPRVKGLC